MSDCSRLITISKQIDAVGGGSEIECPSKCDCDGTRLVTIVQRVGMELRASWCDELSSEIPDGSKFEAEITHHIRLPSRCGAWIGYHDGTFQISGDSLQIIDGRMRATHGFDIHESSDQLCCEYMHSEGLMLATTKSEAEHLNGCRLIANYRTTQEMGPESDPCDPLVWLYWGMTFSGLLVCPCT
jgi:hypothetical protein